MQEDPSHLQQQGQTQGTETEREVWRTAALIFLFRVAYELGLLLPGSLKEHPDLYSTAARIKSLTLLIVYHCFRLFIVPNLTFLVQVLYSLVLKSSI